MLLFGGRLVSWALNFCLLIYRELFLLKLNKFENLKTHPITARRGCETMDALKKLEIEMSKFQ